MQSYHCGWRWDIISSSEGRQIRIVGRFGNLLCVFVYFCVISWKGLLPSAGEEEEEKKKKNRGSFSGQTWNKPSVISFQNFAFAFSQQMVRITANNVVNIYALDLF